MPKIKANDISVYYEEHGEGDSIVFIAGFMADHTVWDVIARRFASNHRVIVFDNRGAGQSDCPQDPYTAELLADDTKALCDALGIKGAHFVGSSMGGQIVMSLAYRYPDLVKSAVLSNSFMKSGTFLRGYQLVIEAKLQLMKLSAAHKELSSVAMEIFAKANMGWIFSNGFLSQPGMVEQLVKFYQENPYPITEAGILNQRNIFVTFDASAWLDKIECPSLVISSDQDRLLPEGEVKKIAKAIPSAQYFSFAGGVGHIPFVEQPEKFCQVLSEFIEKCPR